MSRILEVLSFPISKRCSKLAQLFEKYNNRQLQQIFVPLINSIFGINSGDLGWGLRSITKENASRDFDILCKFFQPSGPMFKLCYKLLHVCGKFDLEIYQLPPKVREMFICGQYSVFYTDLITLDRFRRNVSSISLNAFDYFMFCFAVHGTVPVHYVQSNSLSLEQVKTVYFWLVSEYFRCFLPDDPNGVVHPTNICRGVKPPLPTPRLLRTPTGYHTYFKLAPKSNCIKSNETIPQETSESPRTYAWRTESVFHLFMDTWMRFDGAMDFPTTEFVRFVRILVKQIHAFGNSADRDDTPMAILRKQAQAMMRAKIYPFLRSLLSKCPLDNSLILVLELWLSYIQPWRYTFRRGNRTLKRDIPITNKYNEFVKENVPIYTDIFVQMLPCLERLDFNLHQHALILSRIVKVFGQDSVWNILFTAEEALLSTLRSPPEVNMRTCYSSQRRRFYAEQNTQSRLLYHKEIYTPMFGDEILNEVKELLKSVRIAKFHTQQEIEQLFKEQTRGLYYFNRWIFQYFEKVTPMDTQLLELRTLLDICVDKLCRIFRINLNDLPMPPIEPREWIPPQVDFTSSNVDITRITPFQMRNAIYNLKPTIDPALLPIQSHECKFLVRFLHQVSRKFNEMFEAEMAEFWTRTDIWGKISRQILSAPITVNWFDKENGYSELQEKRLPPRICLRGLGSYWTLLLIGIFLLAGQVLWGAPSLGLLLFVAIICIYLFIRALFTKSN